MSMPPIARAPTTQAAAASPSVDVSMAAVAAVRALVIAVGSTALVRTASSFRADQRKNELMMARPSARLLAFVLVVPADPELERVALVSSLRCVVEDRVVVHQ